MTYTHKQNKGMSEIHWGLAESEKSVSTVSQQKKGGAMPFE